MTWAILCIFQRKGSGDTADSSSELHKRMQGANTAKPLPAQGRQWREREGKKGST